MKQPQDTKLENVAQSPSSEGNKDQKSYSKKRFPFSGPQSMGIIKPRKDQNADETLFARFGAYVRSELFRVHMYRLVLILLATAAILAAIGFTAPALLPALTPLLGTAILAMGATGLNILLIGTGVVGGASLLLLGQSLYSKPSVDSSENKSDVSDEEDQPSNKVRSTSWTTSSLFSGNKKPVIQENPVPEEDNSFSSSLGAAQA